jgi:hypothetical protein
MSQRRAYCNLHNHCKQSIFGDSHRRAIGQTAHPQQHIFCFCVDLRLAQLIAPLLLQTCNIMLKSSGGAEQYWHLHLLSLCPPKLSSLLLLLL